MAPSRTTMDTMGDACSNAGEAATGGWWLYLLECGDGTLYAGISRDVAARLRAHIAGTGARYTRGRGPLRLLASRSYPDRASASRAEWWLKRLPKRRKLAFFRDALAADGRNPP